MRLHRFDGDLHSFGDLGVTHFPLPAQHHRRAAARREVSQDALDGGKKLFTLNPDRTVVPAMDRKRNLFARSPCLPVLFKGSAPQ